MEVVPYLSETLNFWRMDPLSLLSLREEQIALLVARGYSNKRISDELKISEQTVKNHLQSIFKKVGVTNRVELTIYVTGRKTTRLRPHRPRQSARA